jgi:hypothetical protein
VIHLKTVKATTNCWGTSKKRFLEPKPEIQNGFTNEEDVFLQQNLSNDKDVPSPPAKKPLPGMVALPGLGMVRKFSIG